MRGRVRHILGLILAAAVVLALSGDAGAGGLSSLRKYDEVPMGTVSEGFEDFEGAKPTEFWQCDGGAFVRLMREHATDGVQSMMVRFPEGKGALHYRRSGLDGYGGGVARTIEVLGARFLFADRFVFDVFSDEDKPVRFNVTFGMKSFPFTLRPGPNSVSLSTEDIAAGVYRITQATNEIAFSVEGGETASLYLDGMRLERESVGPAMKRWAKCFDFGLPDMAHPGFTAVDSRTGYTPERGYGWLQPNVKDEERKLQTVRSLGAEALDDLLRDGVANLSSPFAVNLPKGRYRVHLVAGGNWTGIAGPRPCDYDFIVKAEGEVRYARPRAADSGERILGYYGRDRISYEFDEDLWAKFAAETYSPIEFEVDVADGRLDLEFQTSPQADRGQVTFLIVYPVGEAGSVEKEIRRLWYTIMRRYNRVSFRAVDPKVASALNKPDLHEEFLDPARREAKVRALAGQPDYARRELLVFARDHFAQVYPDTVPTPEELSEVVSAAGTPGETVPMTINVFALKDLKDLRLDVGKIEGPAGRVIPPEQVKVRFVAYARRMTAQRFVGDWQYQVVPWYLIKPDPQAVNRYMSVRYWIDVTPGSDTPAGRYTGMADVVTSKGVQARVRLEIDVLPLRLAPASAKRFRVIYFTQPFDLGDEAFGRATRQQMSFGLPKGVAEALQNNYQRLHREEVAASLEALRRAGFDMLYGGDWMKDVETANAGLSAPMTFVERETAARAASKRTVPIGKGETSVHIDAKGRAAYLPTLESLNEGTIRSLRDEGLSVFLGGLSTEQSVIEDVGVARFMAGLFLWRSGADGLIVGGARSSCGDPYNPFDGFGGERGSLVVPSSAEWPAPNESRVLKELAAGILDYRYLVTLEKAVKSAWGREEAKKAAKFLADLRAEVPGTLSDVVEPTGGATWRSRLDSKWTAERYADIRKTSVDHLLAIRKALGLSGAPAGSQPNWP